MLHEKNLRKDNNHGFAGSGMDELDLGFMVYVIEELCIFIL
jgi:hypothetical protein